MAKTGLIRIGRKIKHYNRHVKLRVQPVDIGEDGGKFGLCP